MTMVMLEHVIRFTLRDWKRPTTTSAMSDDDDELPQNAGYKQISIPKFKLPPPKIIKGA